MSFDVLLPESILSASPSFLSGIGRDEERRQRVFGCELIQEAGILLQLRQVVMVTGQNIFHRFFYRQSLCKFDAFTVSMGSILLASKMEEQPKMIREVIFLFYYIFHTRRQIAEPRTLDIGGPIYTKWKNEIVNMERYILKELGFCLYRIMDHPHKYILYFVKILDGSTELAQVAWNYLNDSMRLDLCLRYQPKVLSATAIYMASRKIGRSLPGEKCAWYTLMGTDLDTMNSIASEIVALYHENKVQWLEPLCDCDYYL